MYKIKDFKLRYIFNSHADKAIEAEVILQDDSCGRASSPSAITPGKLEKVITNVDKVSELYNIEQEIKSNLLNVSLIQRDLDEYLASIIDIVGADITLALSLAFARAVAFSLKTNFVQYLATLLQKRLCMKLATIIIPIFSGGVHTEKRMDSFQQIMVCIKEESYEKSYEVAKIVYNYIEKKLVEKQLEYRIGSSGGYVVENLSTKEKLEMLYQNIAELSCKQSIRIGIDIAAEHIYQNRKYYLDEKEYSRDRFLEIISHYILKYNIVYIEDPFVSDDIMQWKKILVKFGREKFIVGDDLFATQIKYIDPMVANGVVIKMNQVGTLTGAISAVRKAQGNNMIICVSHRSYETEDTAMCDLAIASSADFIKIGGIRRGERIIKYNQLISLNYSRQYKLT